MRRVFIAGLVLLGVTLACGTYVTPTPTVSPITPTATATPAPSSTPVPTVSAAVASSTDTAAVIRSSVNVHTSADVKSEVIGYVYAGQEVTVLGCAGDYCQIRTDVLNGYVFRGCLSGNDDKGCEAK